MVGLRKTVGGFLAAGALALAAGTAPAQADDDPITIGAGSESTTRRATNSGGRKVSSQIKVRFNPIRTQPDTSAAPAPISAPAAINPMVRG